MNKFIIVLSIALFSTISYSQNEAKQDKPTPSTTKHYIGLNAGGVTGLGFSYRYWPSKLGIQVTGIPIFFANKGGHFTSIGVSALYTLKDNRIVDLYGYLGNHFVSVKQNFTFTDNNGNIVTNTNKSNLFNVGAGFGFKFDFLESLDFNIQGGYGVYGIGNKDVSLISTLTTEIGFYYHL